MPTSPLIVRALVAAIALQLSAAGLVATAGGTTAEVAAAIERAEILPTVGLAHRGVLTTADAAAAVELTTATPPPDPAPTPPPAPPAPTGAGTAPPAPAPTRTPPPAPAPAPAPPAAPAPVPAAAPPAPAPETAPAIRTTAAGSWRDPACESSMLQWVGEVRVAQGRARVADDPAVDHVAFAWSDRLAATGQLAHNPGYADQIFAARPEAMTAGEVVGRGTEPRPIFDEFMRSPAHRDVILGPAFTHVTVGCVRDAGGQVWVAANFWG